ncbi:hypothetical protein AMS68_003980 [Peltaster fructicola]|uniref:AB hydrolase-1 domain-containing protein n=1 Tax=Peltaster fructicola TaxID=286661 RepID=A0A6H0XUQ2_9PEZI|nr:hypothetical protein AMS68_003980 [Peltaster fructicola]
MLALLRARKSGLYRETSDRSRPTQYHIHGESLAGFQLQSHLPRQPYSLDEIKERLIKRIDDKAAEIIKARGLKQDKLPVVLIGHSIGTWLILEAIESASKKASTFRSAKISAGILLFPTVLDLAKSPNGLRLGVGCKYGSEIANADYKQWILQYRHTAVVLSLITRILFFLIPLIALTPLLEVLLRMPYHSALVTASFLKKGGGVRQGLHMARDELAQVREDVWSDALWGVQSPSLSTKEAKTLAKDIVGSPVKLYFYWGSNDHWVANATRDAVIARRAQTAAADDRGKPVMHIDSHGLPHAFALHDRDARLVADKVAGWIEELRDC